MKTPYILSIAILAAASAVSADTTTTTAATGTTTSACAAESILDACLDTTEGYLSLCESQDFSCLCDKYTTIMTCFGNCPDDDRRYAIDSQRQLNCANASAFATTTTSAKSQTASTTPTPTSSGAADSTGSAGTNGDATSTGAAAATSSGAADTVAVGQHGTGLLAALAGVVAVLL